MFIPIKKLLIKLRKPWLALPSRMARMGQKFVSNLLVFGRQRRFPEKFGRLKMKFDASFSKL